jgi:hypothetical protein
MTMEQRMDPAGEAQQAPYDSVDDDGRDDVRGGDDGGDGR